MAEVLRNRGQMFFYLADFKIVQTLAECQWFEAELTLYRIQAGNVIHLKLS